MVIHQQDSSVESERRYSPEEAGEILKLAANLQDDSFSVEQLRAIAREAGIDDQQLNRAIAQYEQSKRQAAPQNQTGRRGRNRRLIAAAVGIVLAVLLTLVILGGIELPKKSDVDPAVSDAYPASFIGETAPLESDSRTLLASSRSCTVYKAPQNDGVGEQVVIQRRDGSEFVVGNRFSRVVSASISPTGKHIALFDEATGEVWVVDVNGEGLHSVARVGEVRGDRVVTSQGSPLAGWANRNGRDYLKARMDGGGFEYVFVEQ